MMVWLMTRTTCAVLILGILLSARSDVSASVAAAHLVAPVLGGSEVGRTSRLAVYTTSSIMSSATSRAKTPVEDSTHPLYRRRVFWNGFEFVQDFIINFLQVNQSSVHKYTRRGEYPPSCTRTDILVLSGPCAYCSTFQGLIVYVDGEAGQLQLQAFKTKINLIYLGVSQASLPPDTAHIKLMYGVSALHYNSSFIDQAFRRNNVNITEKTKFVAYAASKCLKHREKIFDALVDLSNAHKLGEITAYGKCHGSSKNFNTHHSVSHTAATRLNYVSNHILFKPYRFVLCMENTSGDHYMTEKIFNAYQAGAIPIYWGASMLVRDLFHPDSLVLVDPEQPELALARILAIEKDPALYRRVLRTPPLRQGSRSLRKYFASDIPLTSAADPRRMKQSLSNYIWASILQRLKPITLDSC